MSDEYLAAVEIVVDIVGEEANPEFAPVADGVGGAGDIQRFGQDKLDAPHRHIPAAGAMMRGDAVTVQYAQKRRQPLIFRGLPLFLLLICY